MVYTIAFFEIEQGEREFLEKRLGDRRCLFFGDTLDKHLSSLEDVNIISPFIYSKIARETLLNLPNLSFVATRSTGYDHIDLSACRERNILVSNVPIYGEHTVAEHTFALILALSRKIYNSVDRTRKGDFSLNGLCGFELFGKTLGVIGVGHIGECVIRIASGFGMNIKAYERNPDFEKAKRLGYKGCSLDELLSDSDIITLHIPLTGDTHHFIDKEKVVMMKKGSILINTSRGGIVETEAIVTGLDQGILAGVGLDVLEEECFLKEERQLLTKEFLEKCDLKTRLLNNVLLNHPNVLITPHNAFNSKEALFGILTTTIANIDGFLARKPINTVSYNI